MKGNLIIGGTISPSFEKEKDIKYGTDPNPDATYTTNKKSFETDLTFGYFLINHMALGLKNELLFSNSRTTSDLTSNTVWDIDERNILIGPFIRYYLDPGFFFEGYGGLGLDNIVLNDSRFKIKNYTWSAGIGYSLFLNKNVSIEPIVKYGFFHKKDADNMEDVSSMNLSFSIGFQIYLNVKRKDTQNF
jgi:hypothetical protein